jgi:hypothetical protein
MFVRFQERNNDGRRPKMVPARLAWVDGKRRSRWRIGVDQGAKLQPYRLLVSVIENRRVEGKVRQEHIADLGAIDGHLVSGFYAGVDPAVVNAILAGADGCGMEQWYRKSVRTRAGFWRGVHDVLSRLSNRIDAETAAKLISTINARIPMLSADEAAALEKWNDDAEIEDWERVGKDFGDIANWEEEHVQFMEKRIGELREEITVIRSAGVEGASKGVEETRKAIANGDRQTVEQLSEARQHMSVALLQLLAKKAS